MEYSTLYMFQATKMDNTDACRIAIELIFGKMNFDPKNMKITKKLTESDHLNFHFFNQQFLFPSNPKTISKR